MNLSSCQSLPCEAFPHDNVAVLCGAHEQGGALCSLEGQVSQCVPSVNVSCVENSDQLKSLSACEPHCLHFLVRFDHTYTVLFLTLSSAHVAMMLCCPISFQSTLVTAIECPRSVAVLYIITCCVLWFVSTLCVCILYIMQHSSFSQIRQLLYTGCVLTRNMLMCVHLHS